MKLPLRIAALALGSCLLATACDDDDIAYQPDQPNADAGDAGKDAGRSDAAVSSLDSGLLGGLDSGLNEAGAQDAAADAAR